MKQFFEKLSRWIGESFNVIRAYSRNILERVNINSKIKNIDNEKNRILQNIGTIVYNLHMNGEIELESCNAMFDEVSNIDKQIISLQKRVEEIESDDVIIPASQNEQGIPDNGIVCECGHANKEEAKFCAFCGKEL